MTYQGRNIHVPFPARSGKHPRAWFLIPHEEMVELATTHANWTNTDSWQKGRYSTNSAPSLVDALHEKGYRIAYAIDAEEEAAE